MDIIGKSHMLITSGGQKVKRPVTYQIRTQA